MARYDPAQLVIVEFTTPQLAGDNDWNIRTKTRELWNQGKPAPTAYRRVGNYAVFVFHAANEQAANQLIDQVKYEQVVQWLGDNPNWLREAQRQYTETMLGTFVSVVKASGLAAVLVLASADCSERFCSRRDAPAVVPARLFRCGWNDALEYRRPHRGDGSAAPAWLRKTVDHFAKKRDATASRSKSLYK